MERIATVLKRIVLLPVRRRIIGPTGGRAASAGTALLCVIVLAAVAACSSGDDAISSPTDGANDTTPTPTQVATVDVEVVSTEDVSFGTSVQYSIAAVVDFPLTSEEAQSAMDSVIADFVEVTPVNAVAVLLYDYEALANDSFTIAKAEFAPDGDWDKAGEVETGDYDTHETVYEFRPKMDDPEAALAERPTEAAAQLCGAYSESLSTSPLIAPDQRELEVAESEGVELKLVSFAVLNCTSWTFR